MALWIRQDSGCFRKHPLSEDKRPGQAEGHGKSLIHEDTHLIVT